MKFYAEPNLYVRVNRKPLKNIIKGFLFNEKGEFETDNPRLIIALKRRFKYDQATRKCKKCDFATDSQGLLLQHYRKEHKGSDKQ